MDLQILIIPELLSMAITLVSVFILYLILKKYLHEPVTEILEKRKEGIRTDIEDAEKLKNEAVELRESYESRIANAKEEGQEIIENSRQRGNEIKESIIAEAREEAQELVKRAKIDIEREKERSYEEMRDSTAEMAVLIASKIIDENMTVDSQQHLIDQFIDEVGNIKWEN